MILVFKHTYLGTGISTELFLSYRSKSVLIYTLNGNQLPKNGRQEMYIFEYLSH